MKWKPLHERPATKHGIRVYESDDGEWRVVRTRAANPWARGNSPEWVAQERDGDEWRRAGPIHRSRRDCTRWVETERARRTEPTTQAQDEAKSHAEHRRPDLGEVNWASCPGVERSRDRMAGAWCFEGTRITVASLFENLAGGSSVDEYVKNFPGVGIDRAVTVLQFQADRLKAAWKR